MRKTVLISVLTLLLVSFYSSFAFAAKLPWLPPIAPVTYVTAEERAQMQMIETDIKLPVDFKCLDEETAGQFYYDYFSLSLPLLVDVKNNKIYLQLPTSIGGEEHLGLGPSVPVVYVTLQERKEGAEIPLLQQISGGYVYVKVVK